jgi:hypothetical protein
MMAICAVEEKSSFFVECAAGGPENFGAFIERHERCRKRCQRWKDSPHERNVATGSRC